MIAKVGLGDQPTIKEEGEQTEQDAPGNETDEDEQTNEPTTQEENQTATKGPVQKKFDPGQITPDVTGPTVVTPMFYNMKIIFNSIEVREDHDPWTSGCGEYDLGVYVQGKLIHLSDVSGTPQHPTRLWKVCAAPYVGDTKQVYFKPGTEISVDIPVDPESHRDAQPLSIFTVGVEVDNCGKVTWPKELQNVQEILTEKGTTRPYYAGAMAKIADIQSQMSQAGRVGDEVCGDVNKNDVIDGMNILLSSPSYGKRVSPDTTGNPPSKDHVTCASATPPGTPSDFCLSYTIHCPNCAATRVH